MHDCLPRRIRNNRFFMHLCARAARGTARTRPGAGTDVRREATAPPV